MDTLDSGSGRDGDHGYLFPIQRAGVEDAWQGAVEDMAMEDDGSEMIVEMIIIARNCTCGK